MISSSNRSSVGTERVHIEENTFNISASCGQKNISKHLGRVSWSTPMRPRDTHVFAQECSGSRHQLRHATLARTKPQKNLEGLKKIEAFLSSINLNISYMHKIIRESSYGETGKKL